MSSLAQLPIVNQPTESATPSVEELMSGLRPLKPAVELPKAPEPFPYDLVTWGAVGFILFALLSWWIWKRLHRKKNLTPEQTAMYSLEKITEKDMGNDDFIMKLSHIMKRFLEEKKLFTALPQTTEEFLDSLKNSDKLNDHRETLKTFFEQCDFVKFAGGNLADEQRKQLSNSIRTLIKDIAQTESSKL